VRLLLGEVRAGSNLLGCLTRYARMWLSSLLNAARTTLVALNKLLPSTFKPLFCQLDRITRYVDRCALLLRVAVEENCKHSVRRRAQLQFFATGFQTERRIYPDRPDQDSPAVTDVSTGAQQTIFERSVAQGFGVRSDLQRHRSGGLSRGGFTG
jgi:hypothetical protein